MLNLGLVHRKVVVLIRHNHDWLDRGVDVAPTIVGMRDLVISSFPVLSPILFSLLLHLLNAVVVQAVATKEDNTATHDRPDDDGNGSAAASSRIASVAVTVSVASIARRTA